MSDAEATRLRQLIMGFRVTQMIHVAAKLDIADRLDDGPQTPEVLAEAVGAAPRTLYRLLRALASIGIFFETEQGAFALTPTARLLTTKEKGSLRSMALLYGEDFIWTTYGNMFHSVQTGEPAFARCHGEALYPYLESHPEAAALFHEAMSSFSDQESAAILAAYDFSAHRIVVDVGGGHGALIAALLKANSHLTGIILDLEAAAEGAQRLLANADLAERATFVAGDFFNTVPDGGDLYLLKSVIHNWNDTSAKNILSCCRQAMTKDARLVVIERVVPPGNVASEAKLFDINMLVGVGGQERTEQEYEELFGGAGFKLLQVIATRSPVSLIEGVPVG